MNMIAASLNRRLGPAVLRSESDIETISSDVLLTKFNSPATTQIFDQ